MGFIFFWTLLLEGFTKVAFSSELATSKGRLFKSQYYHSEIENLRNDLYRLEGFNRSKILQNREIPGLKTFASTNNNNDTDESNSSIKKKNLNKCEMRGSAPSNSSSETVYECLTYWSEVAADTFQPACGGAVKKDLLMCIFLREHRGRMEENTCTTNGCGIAQMTTIGTNGVKEALRHQEVLTAYQKFFINIGREDLANQNLSGLDRIDGLNMQRAVGMASALICQKVFEGAGSSDRIAEKYNGNPNNRIRLSYKKFVSNCITDFQDGAISAFTRFGGEIKLASARLSQESWSVH